ncbi:hypothetical protein [uncultured Faecalicoccus sp.]|uniref:hypothetical protein n=1 Tax=uncultured Faecalicoccus sp. TaxID=1971760 RepID=UPI002587787E|nr:hypothetical protein [uncultured Faecalicoccus sp.]
MRIKIKNILIGIIYYVCVMLFLIDELHMPSTLKYVPDVLLICVFLYTVFKYKSIKTKPVNRGISILFIAFLLYSFVSSLVGMVGFKLFVWAFRCTFRFYVFYYLCIRYLQISDVEKVFLNLEKLYLVNMIVLLYQFFVKGLRLDFLGGLFGSTYGCNGYLNVFLIIMLIYVVNQYFHKKATIGKLGFYLVSSLTIVGMAEIKFFYIEVVAVILIALVVNKPTVKTISFAIIAAIGLIIGLEVLRRVFPDSYLLLFDQDSINNYLAAGWAHGKQIGRTTAIGFINDNFFNNQFIKKIFGLGFGNCEFSNFFESDFARMYKYTNYRNYTFAMQYLETGMVGLVLYVSFFISIFMYALGKKYDDEKLIWVTYVKILIPLVLMLIWYSDACKSEPAYLIFFALAVFGVVSNSCKNDVKE